MTARFRLGLDIGGTFTDLVLLDRDTGRLDRHKRLTTPEDPSVGALTGIDELLATAGLTDAVFESIAHGTTLVANAILERKGVRTALVVTAGFRDVLEMGHENRYDIYDLDLRRTPPLVPRHLRFEVQERLARDGSPLVPIASDDIDELCGHLKSAGVEAVAVCLLHSFQNADHELAIREQLRRRLPNVAVSLSSEVAPEIREFERMSTTVANAYVQPILAGYLARMADGLSERGYRGQLYLMLSEGGTTSSDVVGDHPIRLVESGPAAGVLYAQRIASRVEVSSVVAFDMGGTTAKACLVTDGQPRRTSQLEVARAKRFKKGSGIPLSIPSIEIIEIGAGGGSIARVDDLGMLQVGPESAGAEPGPACYGRGGVRPTVTDANLLLGYLGADSFLGGRLRLDQVAAEAAIDTGIAGPLGMGTIEAASGIYRLVGESMASAIRVHVAEAGVDPRGLVLVAFGGAGPLHASYVARALGFAGFLAPTNAGVASAIGLLTAPVSFDVSRSVVTPLSAFDPSALEATFNELEQQVRALLYRAGVEASSIAIEMSMDMRYVGQYFEVPVRLGPTWRDGSAHRLYARFSEAYAERFGHSHDGLDAEILTCRVHGHSGAAELPMAPVEGDAEAPEPTDHRHAYFHPGGLVSCPVYDRTHLRPGHVLQGPAIVEEEESTTIIEPATVARVDAGSGIWVDLTRASGGLANVPAVG